MIVASFGLFFVYVDPTYTDPEIGIKALNIEKERYDTALTNSKNLQIERDKFLDQYNGIDSRDRENLLKALPDNIDNVRLIIDIDELAKKYGMRIRNFTTNTKEASDVIGADSGPKGTLTLSFTTTASYNTFLAFSRALEQSLRIIDISSISFASSNSNPLYDYNVTIKTYWLK